MSFTARPYLPADEANVLALLREVLGTGRAFDRTTDFWRWKHFSSPFGASLLTIAANGEVLGLRAFMRWQFRDGARVLSAVRAVDTATHPAHRRLGIFSTLTTRTVDRARADGVDLIFNTPNRVSLAGYLKMGWTFVGRPRLLVKVLRPVRAARVWLTGRAHGDTAWDVPLPRVDAVCAHRGLETLLTENDRMCTDRVRTARTGAYVQWRYRDAPSLPYHAAWQETDTLEGAVIVRPTRRRGLRELLVSELFLTHRAARQAATMVRAALEQTAADYAIACAPAGSAHDRVLRAAGFLPVPRVGQFLVVRPLSAAGVEAAVTSMARWHFSLGDLEVF